MSFVVSLGAPNLLVKLCFFLPIVPKISRGVNILLVWLVDFDCQIAVVHNSYIHKMRILEVDLESTFINR